MIQLAGDLPRDYLVEYISIKTRDYVEVGRAGKSRFRKLPSLLRSLWWFGEEYKEFKKRLERVAAQKGCRPEDLQEGRDWEEFRW